VCSLPIRPGPHERTRVGRGPDTVTGRYLGVDVGTSATKVSLVTEDTTLTASAGYPTRHGRAGEAEQDPAAWSQALATALRR
jgi:sugar (pentulose or hexulose) kinase